MIFLRFAGRRALIRPTTKLLLYRRRTERYYDIAYKKTRKPIDLRAFL